MPSGLVFVLVVCERGSMQTVYEAAGGADGMLWLAHAWHARVMADEVVSHAFSHGFHPDHGRRLAAYWGEALGGPTDYSDSYGDETDVVRIHSGNGPHQEMDRRAIACFDQALADADLDGDARLRQVLHDYFAWATVTTMPRYHRSADEVPAGLRIPQWSLVHTPKGGHCWNGVRCWDSAGAGVTACGGRCLTARMTLPPPVLSGLWTGNRGTRHRAPVSDRPVIGLLAGSSLPP